MDITTNILYTGNNAIGDDAFFLRLSDNKDYFLHPDGENYKVLKGPVGAGIFKKQNAENFIEMLKNQGTTNVEMVNVKDILGVDPSSN